MKKLFALLSILSLFTYSCVKEYDDGGYSEVNPGLSIYTMGSTTNDLSLDGVSIAMRLGIVLAQLEQQGITIVDGVEPEWELMESFTFPLNNTKYNIKDFLLGYSTSITKINNKYTIEYGSNNTYSAGIFDNYQRRGIFTIDTRDLSLAKTAEIIPWKISISSQVDYSGVIEVVDADMELYHHQDGTFNYTINSFKAYNNSDDINLADWHGAGSITIEGYVDLSIDNLIASRYLLAILPVTGGTTLSGSELAFATGGLTNEVPSSPLIYSPSTIGYGTESGIEQLMLVGDYNESVYPTPSVVVEWSQGSSATILYNGNSYTFN